MNNSVISIAFGGLFEYLLLANKENGAAGLFLMLLLSPFADKKCSKVKYSLEI